MLVEQDINVVISHYHDIEIYLATRGTDIKYSCHVNGSPFWFTYSWPILPHQRKVGYEAIVDAVEGHGEFVAEENYPVYKRFYQEARESLRKRALQKSAVVTTLTDCVASELKFCYEVEPEVVRPGVGNEWFEMDVNAVPRDIEGVTTDHAILNVGRLDERKRNKLLIRAFARITKERDDVTLIIGGTGNEGDTLRTIVDDLEINNKVVFPGYIPEEELPKYYTAADILAHPAWVAYGLVPLEAYVLGTKVAISTDTMVKEIIADEPGVQIIAPKVSEWAVGMCDLLDAPNHIPNRTAIPTWTQYFDNKYEAMVDREIF